MAYYLRQAKKRNLSADVWELPGQRKKHWIFSYFLKSCVDTFSYKFKETDPETGEEKEIKNIFEFTKLIDNWVLGFERNDRSQVL